MQSPFIIFSGAKHISLSSHRPFRSHCSVVTLFHSNQTNTILVNKNLAKKGISSKTFSVKINFTFIM